MSTRRSVADAFEWFGALHEKLELDAEAKSPRRSSRRLTSVWASFTMSASTISTSIAPAAPCRAAKASASASPARSARGLSGVLYVLDEPSIGLHQKDNDRLLETLKRLKRLGNTVLVVEHDEDAIRHADHIIDMGPGAGVHGGEVVCAGHARRPARVQGQHHCRLSFADAARSRSSPSAAKVTGKYLTVHGATANNLHGVTAAFPLGTFTCVTGVSG